MIDRARHGRDYHPVAFVSMPEQVHPLVYPKGPEPRLDLPWNAINPTSVGDGEPSTH